MEKRRRARINHHKRRVRRQVKGANRTNQNLEAVASVPSISGTGHYQHRRTMKFSYFFIERPIFAMVISIVIVIAGLLAYFSLPTAQYPEIAPPTVQVTASFPGADPKVVAETVATPIEEQVNGVE